MTLPIERPAPGPLWPPTVLAYGAIALAALVAVWGLRRGLADILPERPQPKERTKQ